MSTTLNDAGTYFLQMEITAKTALLAIEIADHAAPADLESVLIRVSVGDDVWYDLDSLDNDEKEELSGVIEYCELRGLIRRHSDMSNLIQTLES